MSNVNPKFRAAIMARENNRLMLAEEMRRQHASSARLDSLKRIGFAIAIIVGGYFCLQRYFDRAYDMASSTKKQNIFSGISLILGQIKSQAKNPKNGIVQAPPKKAVAKEATTNSPYIAKEFSKPRAGTKNAGYKAPSLSQEKLVLKPNHTKRNSSYRAANMPELNRVKKSSRPLSSPYARVGTAIPLGLAKNLAEFPDLH